MTTSPKKYNSRRFLFIVPWGCHHLGGVTQVVNNLARELTSRNDHAAIVLNTAWGSKQLQAAQRLRVFSELNLTVREPIDRRRTFWGGITYLLTLPITLLQLRQLVRKQRLNVLNVHYPNTSTLTIAIFAYIFSDLRFILSFHGADLEAARQATGIERVIWRIVTARADQLVGCSRDMRDRIIQAFPKCNARSTIVHNGIDAQSLQRSAHEGAVPVEIHGRRVILNVATLEYKKGQDILIDAFSRISHSFNDCTLVIIGRRAAEYDALQNQVRNAGLDGRVTIIPDLPHQHVLALMRCADLFVLPSRVEPFGIVSLEAALFDTPVIATSVGGIPEVIDHEKSGLLVPPDNAAALAEAIERLLTDTELSKRLAQRLRKRTLAYFTWQRATDEYISLAD